MIPVATGVATTPRPGPSHPAPGRASPPRSPPRSPFGVGSAVPPEEMVGVPGYSSKGLSVTGGVGAALESVEAENGDVESNGSGSGAADAEDSVAEDSINRGHLC